MADTPDTSKSKRSSLWNLLDEGSDDEVSQLSRGVPTPRLTPKYLDDMAESDASIRRLNKKEVEDNPERYISQAGVVTPGRGALGRMAQSAADGLHRVRQDGMKQVVETVDDLGERVIDYGRKLTQPKRITGKGIKQKD